MEQNNITIYVCGFYFDHKVQRVVLIWKNKPAWQKGKLNGVGGKIENRELPIAAMRREFCEETGILHEEWHNLITLEGEDWRVHFFYTVGKDNEFEYAETRETEEVAKIDIESLDDYPHISNLRWLIPMAVYKHTHPKERMVIANEALSAGEGGDEANEIYKKNVESEITRRWNSISYNPIGTRTRESYREEVEKLFNQKEDQQ